jgi:hypothetical protein
MNAVQNRSDDAHARFYRFYQTQRGAVAGSSASALSACAEYALRHNPIVVLADADTYARQQCWTEDGSCRATARIHAVVEAAADRSHRSFCRERV